MVMNSEEPNRRIPEGKGLTQFLAVSFARVYLAFPVPSLFRARIVVTWAFIVLLTLFLLLLTVPFLILLKSPRSVFLIVGLVALVVSVLAGENAFRAIGQWIDSSSGSTRR